MDATVRAFNALPRPQQTPENQPCHYLFSIKGDAFEVFALELRTSCILQPNNSQISDVPETFATEADEQLFWLLHTFINPRRSLTTVGQKQPVAPWSWATDSERLARKLEKSLVQHGVVERLCHLGSCSQKDKDDLARCWANIMKMEAGPDFPAEDADSPVEVGPVFEGGGADDWSEDAKEEAEDAEDPADVEPSAEAKDAETYAEEGT
jgi:hypothetical protein